jgi:hypothetical protein
MATAQGLTDALRRMTIELRQVQAYGQRSRRIIAWLSASLVLDVALTVVVALFAGQANHATDQAASTLTQLHKAQISACQLGNQSRTQEVTLWDHIAAAGTTSRTPAKIRREDAALLAYIRRIFAPRNCPAIYRLRSLAEACGQTGSRPPAESHPLLHHCLPGASRP